MGRSYLVPGYGGLYEPSDFSREDLARASNLDVEEEIAAYTGYADVALKMHAAIMMQKMMAIQQMSMANQRQNQQIVDMMQSYTFSDALCTGTPGCSVVSDGIGGYSTEQW